MSQRAVQIAKSAGVISLATLISRVLGLVREQVLVGLFSRTQTDAFTVAFRIPNLLRDLFAEGAMSSAFVPTFTKTLREKGPSQAWIMSSIVINLLLVLLSLITVAGILGSPWIVDKFAGDFRDQPGKFELTVLLTQTMLPFLPLVALAATAMGMLNSQGRFFIPALAPALFNVGSIVVPVMLYSILKERGLDPILGMAFGTLAGGLMQLLIQVPPLLRSGFRYSTNFRFRHPGVKQIMLLMGPGTIGLAATQVNIFVNTWLATSQGEGPATWLNCAFRLMYLPIGLFGVAIASASLPTISAQVSANEMEQLRSTLSSSLRMVFVINIPASFGLIFLSEPIVSLVYEHGRFGAADTQATAAALIFYALGLSAYSAVKVLAPAFYALGHSRIPAITSVAAVALNVVLNLALIEVLSYKGLALATSIAAFFNFLILYLFLNRIAGRLHFETLLQVVLKTLTASLAMGASCFYFHQWLQRIVASQSLWWEGARLLSAITLGVLVLFLSCKLLRLSDWDRAVEVLSSRLRSRRGKR